MNRLQNYLLDRLLRGYVIALVAVGALFWLMEVLQRFEDLQLAGIRLLDVAIDALLTVPGSLVILSPVVTVMATAGVMGTLQNQRELVVMRASGVSMLRLTRLALVPALALGVAGLAISQWATPALERPVSQAGMDELGETGLMDEFHGLWSRKSNEFLNVREFELGLVPRGIRIYQFGDEGRLIRHVRAETAEILTPDRWLLKTVTIEHFDGTDPHRETVDEWGWRSFLSGEELDLLRQSPARLSLSELWMYVEGLRGRDEQALEYELFLWRRLVLPLACLAMVVVSMGTTTGGSRTRSLSLRVSLAMGIGISYQLVAEMFSYTGLLMRWDPVTVAAGPPAALALVGLLLMARQR